MQEIYKIFRILKFETKHGLISNLSYFKLICIKQDVSIFFSFSFIRTRHHCIWCRSTSPEGQFGNYPKPPRKSPHTAPSPGEALAKSSWFPPFRSWPARAVTALGRRHFEIFVAGVTARVPPAVVKKPPTDPTTTWAFRILQTTPYSFLKPHT